MKNSLEAIKSRLEIVKYRITAAEDSGNEEYSI